MWVVQYCTVFLSCHVQLLWRQCWFMRPFRTWKKTSKWTLCYASVCHIHATREERYENCIYLFFHLKASAAQIFPSAPKQRPSLALAEAQLTLLPQTRAGIFVLRTVGKRCGAVFPGAWAVLERGCLRLQPAERQAPCGSWHGFVWGWTFSRTLWRAVLRQGRSCPRRGDPTAPWCRVLCCLETFGINCAFYLEHSLS